MFWLRVLVVTISVFGFIWTTAAWPILPSPAVLWTRAESYQKPLGTSPPTGLKVDDAGDWFWGQFRNPKGIMAILLLVGGDVIQRAIAQSVGGRNSIFTPIVFSFGWVGYAFNSVATAVGDGTFLPQPDYPGFVVTINSGDRRQNQSWVIGRLIRDLELEVESRGDKNRLDSGLLVTVFKAVPDDKNKKHGMFKPKRHKLWAIYGVVLVAQILVAFVPLFSPTGSKNWSIIVLTAIGNVLAVLTSWLPAMRDAKFKGRKNSDSTYAITRGNGHNHVFIILPDTMERKKLDDGSKGDPLSCLRHLEDTASAVHRAGSATRVLATIFAFFWVILLLFVGGLESDSWFILGVGLIGMGHNVFISGWRREPEEHGIPIKPLMDNDGNVSADHEIGRKEEGRGRPKVMDVLLDLEKKIPGAGHSLLPLFFPGRLREVEEGNWRQDEVKKESIKGRWEERLSVLYPNTN
ncbi:hypothetical protein F5X99DRAFT_370859 [Biscogniauxia marginata]|nr:hypothetical protein F5X99DRAFT_370859 [Biscogniauxia marginata]